MTLDKLKVLEQLDIILHLQNKSIEYFVETEDEYSYDNESVLATLNTIQDIRKREKEPDEVFKLATQIDSMGLTNDDLHEYVSYLMDKEHEEASARAIKNILNSNAWKKLEECNFFRTTDNKQYPKHFHFAFTMPNGINVTGRIFRKSWAMFNVSYKWTDSSGKKKFASTVLETFKMSFDKDWPEKSDMEYFEFDDGREYYARYIAHVLIKRSPRSKASKTLNLVYPA